MAEISPNWQRARRPEQKEVRREAILEAAALLLDAGGLEATGLNAIAREAGISKANIYRYFETREAILLQLLLDEVSEWAAAFRRRLHGLVDSGNVDGIAAAFADTISDRTRFCVLLASLATVLEHNVSEVTVISFKRHFLAGISPVGVALSAAVPALSQAHALDALSMLLMTASGAWPHSHPSQVVRDALRLSEFASMRLDFHKTMQSHATALLRGLS
jgi:AcrR family transcriptional regulator